MPPIDRLALNQRQVKLIRERLNRFYLQSSMRSWLQLAEDIHICPDTSIELPEEPDELTPKPDSKWPLKGEAVRRFAAGDTQRLSLDCGTEVIASYLIHKGFLVQSELAALPIDGFYRCPLAQLFGAQCGQNAVDIVERFSGEYEGIGQTDTEIVEIELSLTPASEGDRLDVTETTFLYSRRGAEPISHLRGRHNRKEFDRIVRRSGSAAFGSQMTLAVSLLEDRSSPTPVPGSLYLARDVRYAADSDGGKRPMPVRFRLVGDHPETTATSIEFTYPTEKRQFDRAKKVRQTLERRGL